MLYNNAMKWAVLRVGLGVVFAASLISATQSGLVRAQEAICTPDTVLPSGVDQDGYTEVAIVPENSIHGAGQCADLPVTDVSVSVQAQTGGEAWMDANKAETAPGATVGSALAWRIIITNNSTQPIVKISALLTSPLHATNLVFDPEAGSVTDWNWLIPELQAGESKTLNITALATASGETDISARVHAAVSEVITDNNQDLAVIVVSGENQSGVLGDSVTITPVGQGNPQGTVLAAATGLPPHAARSLLWFLAGTILIGAVLGSKRFKRTRQ